MVRFRLHHFRRQLNSLFMPDYDMEWFEYEPNNATAPCKRMTWDKAWGAEEARDLMHRLNSKHLARYISNRKEYVNYSTLSMILGIAIFSCIILPQIVQVFSTYFFQSKNNT